jgi:hypothetical protein
MILWDWICDACNLSTEVLVDSNTDTIICARCAAPMHKDFSGSAGKRLPDTSEWIASVREVVDKDSKAPHIVEFLKSPTRDNLKVLMQKEGIRHLELGEERAKQQEADIDRLARNIIHKRMARERIEL